MKHFLFLFLLCSQTVIAQGLDGSWKGQLKVGQQALNMVLNIDATAKSANMVSVDQGNQSLPMHVDFLSDDSVSLSIAAAAVSYRARLVGNELKGTFAQGTFSAPLDMQPTVTGKQQDPKRPYPYTTEEVSFNNGTEATLGGTLCYPVGYKQGQRVPVVLMVTGSGTQNRNQEFGGHKPFLVIADWLARHGIASLRYDDRGAGASTGDPNKCTTYDFAKDAEAGIQCLRQMGKFSRVGLLGCSEGGLIGYMLGSEKKIDFLVSISGPACKIDTLMLVQYQGLIKVQGGKEGPKTVDEARRLMIAQYDLPWAHCFLDIDARPLVRRTQCPVLALCGEKDLNVPVSVNIPALKANLPANKKNKVKVYPGLNHLLQHCTTGNPLEIPSLEETISPEVLQDISDWINAL